MTLRWKIAIGAIALAALAGSAAVLLKLHKRPKPITLEGAVVQEAKDPRAESPIAGVEVTADTSLAAGTSRSNSSGLFRLRLRPGVKQGQPITLLFSDPGYQPKILPTYVGDQLYVVQMVPKNAPPLAGIIRPSIVVSDVVVRYSVQSTTTTSVGTDAKTFQVVNTPNVPCHHHSPCSPDGKWKATEGSASLDAGTGNTLVDPRVSCIAGPCPFTSADLGHVTAGGRVVKVTARTWSDTATFLVQAEVVHPAVSDTIQESYPVIFGRAMHFSLPATAEGPSLEATLNGVRIVFPLPPDPDLSWVNCTVRLQKEHTKFFRCQLKPQYKF